MDFLFWSCVLAFIMPPVSKVNAIFTSRYLTKRAVSDTPKVIGVYHDIATDTGCAVMCIQMSDQCTAFRLSDGQCHLFTGSIETEAEATTWSKDKAVYLMPLPEQPPCTSHSGFEFFTTESKKSYCLKFIDFRSNYENARSHCRSLGAFMASANTLEKSKILIANAHLFSRQKSLLLNFKYDAVSDTFRGERSGDVLPVNDPMWSPSEPYSRWITQCVMIGPSVRLNDVSCGEIFAFACEMFEEDL